MLPQMLTILSVLALFAAAGLIGLGLIVAVWGVLQRNRLLARRGLQVAGGVAGLYLVVLGGVGLASHERVLPVGAEKYFCELDCHLAYSVEQVIPVSTGGSKPGTWAVKLKTRFDQRTISPTRGDAPLWPNPRQLYLVGSDGNAYGAEAELDRSLSDSSTPITTALRPGQSYSSYIGFVLPPGVKPTRLEVAEDLFLNGFLIGHERSWLHRATYFELGGT